MLNHIVIMGRLTRDPELRYTSSNIPVASFSVAVDRDYGKSESGERQTDFINVVAWRATGEFVSKYFTKGSMIVVSGRLQIRDYTDREGNRRTAAEIVAENVYFGESKRRDDSGESYSRGETTSTYRAPTRDSFESAKAKAASYEGTFQDIDEADGELPF